MVEVTRKVWVHIDSWQNPVARSSIDNLASADSTGVGKAMAEVTGLDWVHIGSWPSPVVRSSIDNHASADSMGVVFEVLEMEEKWRVVAEEESEVVEEV